MATTIHLKFVGGEVLRLA